MKIMLLVFLLIFASCTNAPKSSISRNKSDSLINSLIGKWGGLEDSPTFEIKKDSVYFYEQAASYPLKIEGPDMIVYFPKLKAVWRNIHVSNDTLYLYDEQGLETKGLRKK